MAASSKYLQLSSSVLMEYQYADQSDLASHSRLTSAAKIWKLVNGYTNVNYFINDDSSKSLTGNVRDRSAVLIDKTLGKYGYLNIDAITALNDKDSNLTDTASLPNNPTAVDSVVYDKIKLHFTQGFDFEQNEGLLLELSYEDATSAKQILASIAYIEEDTYGQLNPAPFLFAGKQYTSYIEIEVPALYNLIEDYRTDYVVGGDSDIAAYNISNIGYNLTTPLNVKFGFIDKIETINGNKFFYSYYQKDVALNKTDQFSSVTASVSEASDGDYYELQPLNNGNNIENYINGLNNDGGDYIILHDIVLYEQVVGSSSFVKTQDLQIAQIDEFQDPIVYRPVIKNSANAVSYRIDYTTRLYNRLDNTQIWKTASIVSMDVKKYGKSLNKLQIGSNPVIANVYNDVIQKTLNLTNANTEDVSLVKEKGYTKYVTSFIDTANVHLSNDIVYQRVIDGETIFVSKDNASAEDTEIFGQGEIDLDIYHTDAFYKFVIYNDDRNGEKTQMDLNGIGRLKMQFYVGSKKAFEVEELADAKANRSKGEAIFKIPASKSQILSGKKDQPLYIVAKPEDGGPETVLYQAKFTGPGAEQANKKLQKALNTLKREKKNLDTELTQAENEIVSQRNTVQNLRAYASRVQTTLAEYKKRVKELEDQIENLESREEIQAPSLPEEVDRINEYLTRKEVKTELQKVVKDLKDKRGPSKNPTKSKRPKQQTQKEADLQKNRQSAKKGSNKYTSQQNVNQAKNKTINSPGQINQNNNFGRTSN